MANLKQISARLTPELAQVIVSMRCIVRIAESEDGVEIRDTRPLVERMESPIEGRGVLRTLGSTHFIVTQALAIEIGAKHLPGEKPTTPELSNDQSTDTLKVLIADRLIAQGWTIVDDLSFTCTSAVATKEYSTAVGPKTAIAYLEPGDNGARRLIGDYYSEGNNVLSTTTIRFTPDLPSDDVQTGADRFTTVVDDIVSRTYAVRLLRPSITQCEQGEH